MKSVWLVIEDSNRAKGFVWYVCEEYDTAIKYMTEFQNDPADESSVYRVVSRRLS